MNKNLILSGLAVACILFTNAQPDKYAQLLVTTPVIAFETQQTIHNDVPKQAITCRILADEEDYLKDWKKFLSSKYLLEGKRISGFYTYTGVKVNDWSADSLNLYFKTERDGDAARIYVLLEKGRKFLSEKEDSTTLSKVKATMKQHAKDFYLKQYEEHIADQQKHYDNQVKEYEKLLKQEEKLNMKIDGYNKAKSKTDASILEQNNKLREQRNTIKSINLTLDQKRKITDQAEKEVSAQNQLIQTNEAEYNKLNSRGELNTKEGKRVMKNLEKERGKMKKLQARLNAAHEDQTKTENQLLKAEQEELKMQTRMSELNADIDKSNAEINAAKTDLDKTTQDIKEEKRQVEEAKLFLEKLQAAKAGLAVIP